MIFHSLSAFHRDDRPQADSRQFSSFQITFIHPNRHEEINFKSKYRNKRFSSAAEAAKNIPSALDRIFPALATCGRHALLLLLSAIRFSISLFLFCLLDFDVKGVFHISDVAKE